MFRLALRQSGIDAELTVLEDGVAALDYLAGDGAPNAPRPCDLMLLDLNLPRLGGLEVLREVRSTGRLMSLPVIVMSGSANAAEVERCYRAGANSFICKPAHLQEILAGTATLLAYWAKCVSLPQAAMCSRAA